MNFCKNCGTPLEDGINFCNNCGTPVEVPQVQPQAPFEPTQSQPQAPFEPTQPMYQQPISYDPSFNPYIQPQAPQPTVAGKVMGIIGMILGIEGLVYSIFMFLCAFVVTAVCAYTYVASTSEIASIPGMMITYSIIGLAQGVAALILGSKARNRGNTSAMPRVAKGMGIPTIILSGIAILLSILATTMMF